jgi:peptide-methionine (S)-S-oxide reductase
LEVFWSSHDATQKPWSTQYKAAVYYHNEEQRELAIETRDLLEAKINKKVHTEIVPVETFYLAEAYHQKYYLQNVPLFVREYRQIYPLDGDFFNSTAVARVNGYVAGYGTIERLQEDLDLLGLTDAGKEELQDIVYSLERSR